MAYVKRTGFVRETEPTQDVNVTNGATDGSGTALPVELTGTSTSRQEELLLSLLHQIHLLNDRFEEAFSTGLNLNDLEEGDD